MSRKKKKTPPAEDTNVLQFPELNLEFADDAESTDEALSASDVDAEDVGEANVGAPDDSLSEGEEIAEENERLIAAELEESDDVDAEAVEAEEEEALEMQATEESVDAAELVAADDQEASDSFAASESENDAESEALAGTELESFESAAIEDVEVLTEEQIRSVVESVLFSTDKPLSIAVIKQSFKGTNVRSKEIREALTALEKEYLESPRGFMLAEAGGGFQLRTKADNIKYLRQSVKVKPFRLSGPALEVLSIVAYKQPTTKNQIDEIRGVESGHLLRALMEKGLIAFGERSDLPGKPMYYESTRKFLEIFSLRNLAELPSLTEIDQLLPEGIGEPEDKETLSDLTGQLSQEIGSTYSEGEDELLKITDELTQISTSSDFFEQEKQRQREKRDQERAQDVREAMILGNPVEPKDQRWLERYEAQLIEGKAAANEVDFVTGDESATPAEADAAPENSDMSAESTDEPEPAIEAAPSEPEPITEPETERREEPEAPPFPEPGYEPSL